MATTTPNFGWPVPTSTDLVKNGATAIEALGDAIDASMVDLEGGTTGQVLAKNSNTDMDFVWTTPNPGDITGVTAGTGISGGGTSGTVTITNSMATEITAKGDLIVGTGSATFDNLAAGSNGDTLVADSSTSTGLRYQGSQAAGKNYAINGAFDIWQRGTTQAYTGAAATGFIADRWGSYTTNSGTASRDTTLIQADSQYALRWTSSTASGGNLFLQSVETANAVQLAGKTVTLTVYVAGTVGKSPSIALGYSTTTDLGPVNAFTDITATSGTTTVTSSGTYQKLSAVYAVPSTAKTLRVSLATGTLNNTEYINFSQCQLELGSVATAFTRTGGTIQGELAACSRYFQAFNSAGSSSCTLPMGFQASTTTSNHTFQLPINMRTTPSASFSAITDWSVNNFTSQPTLTASTVSSGRSSNEVVTVLNTWSGAVGATASIVEFVARVTAARYYFSAEL